MNAEYTSDKGNVQRFTVTPDAEGELPKTTRITERSTCGKWMYEHVLVYEHYDLTHDVAVYTLMGTGKRPA